MRLPLQLREVRIHPLAIPLRFRFEHAAASREVADPVLLQLTAAAPFAEHEGWGETLARAYVTGESARSVVQDLAQIFVPALAELRAHSFGEVLDFVEALPYEVEGRIVHAARTAVELALLDLAGRAFGRRLADVAGWVGAPNFGPPGSLPTVRYSGYVVGSTPPKLRRWLRLQRWYGLRDFKIKVAIDGWEERLAQAAALLQRPLAAGRATLRADANGGWSLAAAHDALETLVAHGVSVLEQPLPEANDADLAWLAEQSRCGLMVDESLLSLEDGQRLIAGGGVGVFNIRLAKHGGLLPALRLAELALSSGVDVQLGCLVGETSVLTAAELAFLEICPRVRFVEGALGTRLLTRDVVRASLRFGYRGRLRARPGFGSGVRVQREVVAAVAAEAARQVRL
jgi:L-Ala-D/L-Glu epimerase